MPFDSIKQKISSASSLTALNKLLDSIDKKVTDDELVEILTAVRATKYFERIVKAEGETSLIKLIKRQRTYHSDNIRNIKFGILECELSYPITKKAITINRFFQQLDLSKISNESFEKNLLMPFLPFLDDLVGNPELKKGLQTNISNQIVSLIKKFLTPIKIKLDEINKNHFRNILLFLAKEKILSIPKDTVRLCYAKNASLFDKTTFQNIVANLYGIRPPEYWKSVIVAMDEKNLPKTKPMQKEEEKAKNRDETKTVPIIIVPLNFPKFYEELIAEKQNLPTSLKFLEETFDKIINKFKTEAKKHNILLPKKKIVTKKTEQPPSTNELDFLIANKKHMSKEQQTKVMALKEKIKQAPPGPRR